MWDGKHLFILVRNALKTALSHTHTHTQSCEILEGLYNATMEELFIWMCDCLLWHWCYTFGTMKWEAFIETCAAPGRQNPAKSHFHSNQLTLIQNNAAGARRDSSSIIPNINREKKRSAYTVIASFTTAISLTVCLLVRLISASTVSYQFLSHSPRLLVIAHHPLIERKGACSVNNLTNLYDFISLEHVSANTLSHKWFIYLWAWGQKSHPCLRVWCTFTMTWHFYIKKQLLECRIAVLKTTKMSPHSTRLKLSEWWQAPWLTDKRASGFNTLLTLLIWRIWCSQLTKLAKHQKSLWYRMWLLGTALVPGYNFLFHWCWAGVSQSFLLLLPTLNIFVIFVSPTKNSTSPLLHTCLAGHCSLTTPNTAISAIFDYFDLIAAATFCQLSQLTLSHEALSYSNSPTNLCLS